MNRTILVMGFVFVLFASWPGVRPVHAGEPNPPRRVNVPFSDGDVSWAESAIFWLGQNKQGLPGRNYADVRSFYTNSALQVRITVVDYYLWHKQNVTAGDDLTLYDAVAIHLDTHHDRTAAPQKDDYLFLRGARHWGDSAQYQRQARGTGSDWDTTWPGDWTSWGGMSWSNGGPNDNNGGFDFGWTAGFVIPWQTIGLSGPPADDSLMGIGVMLYDRDDQPPAGAVSPEPWPETFLENNPATWAEIHFGQARYNPGVVNGKTTTIIRAASPTDNSVEDAWMGGGGLCASGHHGGTEINHGNDGDLFVGTETAPTHFPCFNKSYLRFSLAAIPRGKSIISATLTLHHWGNADPGQAQPSWVHLFSIQDPWDEMSIHWNNAPLAHENISASWIYPITTDIDWPGIAYHWDATKAVAKAYAAAKPVSLAIYGSDTEQHSSKYLTSSETGDWNAEGRPALTVVWGEPVQLELNEQVYLPLIFN